MTPKQFAFAHNIASGMSLKDAYMQAFNSSADVANAHASKLAKNPEVAELIDKLLYAQSLDVATAKREIATIYLDTMRSPDAPQRDKLTAAKQLADLYNLNKLSVEVSADDVFRKLILPATNAEPLVKKTTTPKKTNSQLSSTS